MGIEVVVPRRLGLRGTDESVGATPTRRRRYDTTVEGSAKFKHWKQANSSRGDKISV
jgi:hypothetical protein